MLKWNGGIVCGLLGRQSHAHLHSSLARETTKQQPFYGPLIQNNPGEGVSRYQRQTH